MILTRINAMGLRYQLHSIENAAYGTRTSILLVGTGKKIIVDAPIEVISQAWYDWMNGKFIQDAFHMLNADQREFLMTGITSEEWNEIFSEEEN